MFFLSFFLSFSFFVVHTSNIYEQVLILGDILAGKYLTHVEWHRLVLGPQKKRGGGRGKEDILKVKLVVMVLGRNPDGRHVTSPLPHPPSPAPPPPLFFLSASISPYFTSCIFHSFCLLAPLFFLPPRRWSVRGLGGHCLRSLCRVNTTGLIGVWGQGRHNGGCFVPSSSRQMNAGQAEDPKRTAKWQLRL